MIGWDQPGHHNLIVAQSLAHELFYICAEGLLNVLTCLIEDEVSEDAVAGSFKLDAVLEELDGVIECLFLLVTALEVGAMGRELSHLVHGDLGWVLEAVRYGLGIWLEGAKGLYAR